MKKVLIYYHFSSTNGGGDCLPLSLLEELHRSCDVTLAVDVESGFERAAEFFGYDFDRSRFRVVPVMPPGYTLAKHTFLLSHYRSRHLKALAAGADVCISTGNIMDFGRPAHHFINVIDFGDEDFSDHVYRRNPPLLKKLCRKLAEDVARPLFGMRSKRRMIVDLREHIYPNSEFVAGLMRGYYPRINSTVFYPPTMFAPEGAAPERDPLKIVYLGRITVGKKLPEIIDIVERARAVSGLDIRLSIAGQMAGGVPNSSLMGKADGKAWIDFPGELHGEEKTRFLLSGTYALHAMRNEAFGISITEYLKAGLIAVVPDEGGACEVAGNPELSYRTVDEAVGILVRLLEDAEFRERQRRRCAERAKAFSAEAYMDRQHKLLKEILGS